MMSVVVLAGVFGFALPATGQKLVKPAATVRATLIEMAPDPGVLSGTVAVYRFARYRIDGVCAGRLAEKEIVVGHIVPLDALVGTRPGDACILLISKSNRPLVSGSLSDTTPLSRRADVRWIAKVASSIEQALCRPRR